MWGVILLAAVIGLLATLTTWINRQALDTTSWSNTSGRLLDDSEVRRALSTFLVNELYENVDVAAALRTQLPDEFKGVASPVAAALRTPAENNVDRLLARPRVQLAWKEANRTAHEAFVAIVEDKTVSGVSTAGGVVTLDLRSLVRDLGLQLGLPQPVLDRISEETGQVTVLRSDQLSLAQDGVAVIRILSVWLMVLAVALWLLALVLARGERRDALRRIGWSIFGVGVLLLALRHFAGAYVVGTLTTDATQPVGGRIWLIGTGTLGEIGWAAVAYGLAIVAGAVLAGPTRLATSMRRELAPILNTRQSIAWTVVAVVCLLLIAWGPTHALRTPIGTLILVALVAAGIVALRRETLHEFPEAAVTDGVSLTGWAGARWRARERPVRSAYPSAAVEIDRLLVLRDAGAITAAEFEQAKARALA